MYSKSLLLLLVCFVAATMLVAGCGDDAEKPTDTTTANKPKPKPATNKPPITPKATTPAPKPAAKPPVTPKATTPEAKPAAKPPVTPKPTTPPVTPKPATSAKIKTGWSDAQVGTMVKYKMQNNVTMTQEVIKVTDDTVTVKMTTSMPAMPTPMVRNHDFPRYGKPGPDGKPPEPKGKKLPDQTESDMMGTMAIVMELVEFKK